MCALLCPLISLMYKLKKLATTPVVLLDQAGWMPFSNYVIKPGETSMTVAM